MPTVVDCRYRGASLLQGSALSLVTAEAQQARTYFRGQVGPGDVVAAGLLVVARTARSRFVISAGERAAMLDPVLTVDAAGVHVESFSADGSVHARLTVLPAGLQGERWEPGTVNVDFNEPSRAALAAVRGPDPLTVEIGQDAVAVQTPAGSVIERRVPIADRWVRGFAEAQVAAAGLPLLARFDGAVAGRVLTGLPRGSAGRDDLWGRATAAGLRLTRVRGGGAAWVSAAERIRLLEPVKRHLVTLSVFGEPDRPGPTVWAADLGQAHLVLTLSPHRTRGFSGEGGLLYALVDPLSPLDADRVQEVLGNRRRFTPRDLAAAELSTTRIDNALAWLGAHGRLGYDPLAAEWFGRDLPFTLSQLSSVPPRLAGARVLLEGDRVVLYGDSAIVRGDHGSYDVEVDPPRCECRWWREHPGDRGPCRHILAALLARGQASG